jgi:hypothetical protein
MLTVGYFSEREGRKSIVRRDKDGLFSSRVAKSFLSSKVSKALRGRASSLMHKNATFQLHQAQSLLVCLLVKDEVFVHEEGPRGRRR